MAKKRKQLTPHLRRIKKWLPDGWSLKIDPKQIHRGEADPTTRRITLQSLGGASTMEWMVFFHEVGHVACGRFRSDQAPHLGEYEADHFALFAAKMEGIMVPDLWMVDTKTLIKESIREDTQEGVDTNIHVLHWVT